MSVGHYSFLPWLRRGIANELQTPAAAVSRAALSVTVRVKSDTGGIDAPPRPVLLVGPGDIVGIVGQMVLRTEPRPGIANFEPNYLAYVDFYDEDFAWRYTPERPDPTTHRLTPWLTLLVLREDEFKARPRRPLPIIELLPSAVLAEIVPPEGEEWAWAHVHLNATLEDRKAPNLDALGTLLRDHPDAGYCRLLSPRRLQPNTAYHAFVVPTFEVGRQAGLGVDPPDATPGLKRAFAGDRTHPVYFEWRFSTGAAGDFEALVTALKPRDIDKRVGIRELDIQQPDFHVPPPTGQPNDIVGLEGCLLAPTTEHVPVDPACSLPADLAKEVNRPADEQDAHVDDDVPLVSVPLYGRWHAFVERVQPFAVHRNWINELNTDPRFRTVAGMGTQVIQKNQEGYMKLAWEQIGDVLSLNRKITFLQLSVKASDALFARQLAPLVTERALAITAPVMTKVLGSPITVDALVEQSRLPRAALSGAMRKQLRPRGQLARRALGAPGTVDPVARTIAGLNSGELTAAPPRPAPTGQTYESGLRAVTPSWPDWLRWLAVHRWPVFWLLIALLVVIIAIVPSIATLAIAAVVAGTVAAVVMPRLAAIARTMETAGGFAPAALTPGAIDALPPNDGFVMPPEAGDTTTPDPPTPAPGGGPDSVQGAAFRLAAIELAARIADRPAPLPIKPPLALPGIRDKMIAALKPAPAFSKRHDALLIAGNRNLSEYVARYKDAPAFAPSPGTPAPDPRIIPVMAYPDIKLPMYKPLKELQKDNFVPNLNLVPPDTISLMITNPPVIESYMVGLNHEFARELLWREYPTDQRPSTFRQFWDPSNYVDTEHLSAKDLAEKVRDIRKIHEWLPDTVLGTHRNTQPDDGKPRVVLVIRGELLKRYPHTIVYAQQARWGDAPDHTNHLTLYDETGEKADPDLKDPHFRFPQFRAFVEPDLYFIGFDLLLDEVRGDPTLAETPEAHATIDPNKLGWFFVLQEVVGEPRFGLDEGLVTEADDPLKWDNLSWENLGDAVRLIRMQPLKTEPPGTTDGGAKWSSHAADLAFILYQRPVLVGVHGRKMLANVKTPV